MKFTSALVSLFALAVNQAAAKLCRPVPANFSLTPAQTRDSRELPDPFLTTGGIRITKKSEWACRRSEIAQLAETCEFGPIPGRPTSLDASVRNSNQLALTITVDNKTIQFNATITYPTSGTPPHPVAILIAGASIPIPPTVATIVVPIDALVKSENGFPQSRQGLFYHLYGARHGAGVSAVGIWAIARVIDAIERTADITSLDPTRLAVTGCSRNARTALAVGGFEERIALTIVQEAGKSGDSCYRLRDDDRGSGLDVCNTMQCDRYPEGGQTANFRRFYDDPRELPFDRHSVAALVAPRALLVLQDDIQFTEPKSSFQCMGATKQVYRALGLGDRMAVSLKGAHSLCQFPKEQQALLDAYFRKFLLKEEGVEFDTDVVQFNTTGWSPRDLKAAYSWTVPTLA